jgi:hypothetical protein
VDGKSIEEFVSNYEGSFAWIWENLVTERSLNAGIIYLKEQILYPLSI